MALTPEEVQHYYECDIIELRRDLKDSNKKRTFARSKALDKIIKERSSSEVDTSIQTVLKKLDKDLDDVFVKHEEGVQQIDEEYKNKENLLRLTIDDSFAELKERQLKSLTDVEVQKESELLREDRRETSAVYQLRLLATRYADQGDFERAMKVDNEANEMHARETEDQTKRTNIRFQKRVDQLLIQFGTEIDVLENRLKKGLDSLEIQKHGEIVNQQKTTSVAVQRLLLASINETNKKVKKIELQGEISNRLTNFVRKKANENGMNRKLQYD
ncbi:hypothetical protein TRFO_02309 [Tritrichomonas foetus]|uniref:Uncharacterized protein n=1 Tax=Tritrichomonas foetus TaxID=1144522 RepID=A0A1J4J6K2_9EUKA|nr:hypothetical protein TRFO_02309 [Tritrichomonas foetus]|eukprot:OHS93799.1 hypothetical protein TRFO_02309 [Tritrichomonas foetus]